MKNLAPLAITMCILGAVPAAAEPFPLPLPLPLPGLVDPGYRPTSAAAEEQPQYAVSRQPNYGGGFIEFLFNGGGSRQMSPRQPMYGAPADPHAARYEVEPGYQGRQSYYSPGEPEPGEPARPAMDPRYRRQVIDYHGPEKAGTVIINTNERFLYLIQGDGSAVRYGIGVGRPGFTWAGVKQISMKREWPDWIPPAEMLKRRPDLPRHMAGGPDNPLGARAMYLGSSLYRIHGSNEPWTIGTAVSSGCIRMRNEDVTDLYERVKVGTKVLVI